MWWSLGGDDPLIGFLQLQITDSDAESVTTSNHWMLPNAEFHGLWESLIYDEGIKENVNLSFHLQQYPLNLFLISLPVTEIRRDDHALLESINRQQFDQLQSASSLARPAGNGKDQLMQGNRPETLYPFQ